MQLVVEVKHGGRELDKFNRKRQHTLKRAPDMRNGVKNTYTGYLVQSSRICLVFRFVLSCFFNNPCYLFASLICCLKNKSLKNQIHLFDSLIIFIIGTVFYLFILFIFYSKHIYYSIGRGQSFTATVHCSSNKNNYLII